ncbi:hypothetical protein HY839_04370 [Candidatus Azambacteria bacterium]|nr:hypothetical protein [Candidatus Azambacteria bacterium]
MKKQKGDGVAAEWMYTLLQEIDGIDPDEFKPIDEVAPGEHVVGVVSEGYKKLYALAERYQEKGDGAFDQEMRRALGHKIPKRVLCPESAGGLHEKATAVRGIFWASIRDAHGLWGKEIGIRKGWKIVRVAIEEVPNSVRFFAKTPFKEML